MNAVDVAKLSSYLRVLSTPNRLELLRQLKLPRTSREVEVHPFRKDAGWNQDRILSRQTVEEHLGKLQDAGLVHSRSSTRDGRPATEYEMNHARLFTLVDELHKLCLVPAARAATDQTVHGAEATTYAAPRGPALVLVNGPREGQAFPLDGSGPWTVGRLPGSGVALPHDPFVSRDHARLERFGDGYAVEALATSRNGTQLNWQAVAQGNKTPLRAGDVLGVGRSLLVLQLA